METHDVCLFDYLYFSKSQEIMRSMLYNSSNLLAIHTSKPKKTNICHVSLI